MTVVETAMTRAAILDDYQHVALELADWKSLAPDVEVTVVHEHIADHDKLAARIKDCEIVVLMRERTPFPRALFEKLPNLKLLITTGPRNRSIDMDAAAEHKVVVCGTASLGNPTAELTWALILAITRNVTYEDRALRLGSWQKYAPGPGLAGRTLGVIGLGRQGAAVAKIGKAFDMKVIGWSQNLKKERCDELGVEFAPSKEELLRRSDIVTVHLILSPRSQGTIGAREIGLMKKTAYLVNTSRGPLVDEAALVAALGKKQIAGAALDVYDVEPLPLDSPMRRVDHAVITPHLGYGSLDNFQQMYATAIEDIRAWLGSKPQNVIKAA
jgi:phosphoglycerate dehydrogenase-like enzyme